MGKKLYLLVILLMVVTPLVNTGLSYVSGSSFNAPIAVVEGTSMYPLLREGDLVFTYKPPPNQIKIGDIIIYSAGGKLIIHRVIRVNVIENNYYYVTQGDNNPIPDYIYFDIVDGEPVGVSYHRVVGVVLSISGHTFKIPYLGYLSIWYHKLLGS
ncbi:signal peptidase I [Thermogladius sp. 4427co]|uniref:signal peptidase I n=1 Tax=Thermogladius sp. 4427co TaxID=3450718 RepID=UPI003F7A34E4